MKEFLSRINNIILGGVTVIVTLLLGFIWWFFEPEDQVPIYVPVLIIIIGYGVCMVVYAMASKNVEITYVLPKVISIRQVDSKIIFLVEKNELFAQGTFVTIAYKDKDDKIETDLGIGYVETINSEGNLQVVFLDNQFDSQILEIISKASDKKCYRDSIMIKPTLPNNILDMYINEVRTL